MKTRLGNKQLPARRTQAHTLPLVTHSEHQPKDIEDKVSMYHSLKFVYRGIKVQEYVLFLSYFKLIVNCYCVQKKKKLETKRDISPG